MKRVLIALITTLPLVVGVTAAQAHGSTGGGSSGQAAVAGTVVSVDASAGTFVANAYVLTPPSMGTPGSGDGGTGGSGGSGGSGGTGSFGGIDTFGGSGGTGSFDGTGSFGGDFASRTSSTVTTPTTTQVTITTGSSTTIHVSGVDGPATVSDLAAGDKFFALFPGSSTDTIQTLVANPATSIIAQVPKQFYAFVGTVASTDTTADTITVDLMRSLPSSLIAASTTATFTLSAHTFIIGGSSLTSTKGGLFGGLFGGSLGAVSPGDLVAGGLIGDGGLTATQVEASPLMFLLDLPAPASIGTGTTTTAANHALKETLSLLHGAKVKVKKAHHRGKAHHHTTKKSKQAGRR